MKAVVLAEKPSVARDLARVLGCNQVTKTSIEGKDYIVTWALGHLVEPASPEAYKEEWKKWDMSVLPMIPDTIKLKVIGKTSFQFNAVRNILKRNDVDSCIIATDAGREGELVARWILKLSGFHKTVKRLWISSQTDASIKAGFASLKDGKLYENLYHAAECRSEADWVIGLNVTRALSCRYDAKLSAGRVQTPTLALIINRENEIKNFVSEPYWIINALFDGFNAMWKSKNGINRLKSKEAASDIVSKCQNHDGIVTNIKSEEKDEASPLAYDLTTLQTDADRILGFQAKKTLQVLQGLYERHKIVTYPRTNSKHITDDMVGTLPARLKALSLTPYGNAAKMIISQGVKTTKRFVDNSKVSDHHAIIPTEETVNLSKLTPDEKALWNLIAMRFIAVLSKPYRYRKHTVTIDINGEIFTASGIEIIDEGWRKITGNKEVANEKDEDDNQRLNLNNININDRLTVKSVSAIQKQTKPPARYTEGTLLYAMENAGKFIEDKTLKASIERGGLGTPATRADIIEKLFANYYIEKNGKELVPTAQGYELISVVPEELKSPELTAEWEIRFEKIACGLEKSEYFIKDIRKNAVELISKIKESNLEYKPYNQSSKSCPMCGKKLLTVKGKKSEKLLVCQSRGCGYQEKEENDYSLKRNKTKQERIFNSKMIHKYTNSNAKETFTLGDLLKNSLKE